MLRAEGLSFQNLNESSMDMEYSQEMLRPVIFVGCGGAGVKTVTRARRMIGEYLEDSGWKGGIPRAWKFLGIDADSFVNPFLPYDPNHLPSECWVEMSRHFSSYQDLDSNVMARYGRAEGSVNNDLIGWRPNPAQLNVPIFAGAGQIRAVGRMLGITSYAGTVQKKIDWAFSEAAAGASELLELSQHLGISSNRGEQESKPIVIVLGSIAGGVGSGIMLDIIDLIKQTHADGAFPTLIAYTPDIFGAVQTDGMATNAAAFISELMATSWSKEVSVNPFIPYKGMSYKRGPHATYLIGRKNLRGYDLQDSSRVFESIAQYLTSLTTSPNAQVDFMYQQTCGLAEAAQNSGGYGFLYQEFPGLINSFGVAKISIGRKHFRRWLEQLLGRAVIEHLARNENSDSSQIQNAGNKEPFSYLQEISEWPRLGNEVPYRLRPSVNEFLLEDESQWMRQVLFLFFGDNELGSGEFPDLNAVVHKIIQHRTSALGETSKSWLFDLQNSHDVIQLVRDFLLSDELGLKHYFEESIVDYLSPISKSLLLIGDTSDDRLKVNYSRALQAALQWSSPLFEIDRRMCAEVHPHNLQISLAPYGVSFPEGHPARDLTSEVLRGFLSDSINPTFSNFSDSENVTDSITLVSTCKKPVHPSVVQNFTEPLKSARQINVGPNFSHQWQWRRSRTLTEFIPLSSATRLAAIRGFALARLTGAMSLGDQESCQISGTEGVFQFPRLLLTFTGRNNILPALLESMILTYADIDEKGIEAFSAYRTLIEFGWNHSDVEGEYQFPDFVNEIFLTGDYGKIQILDESRSSRFLNDYESRFDAAKDYLRVNLDRFEKLGSEAPSLRGWRNSIGNVDPDDTLTIELLPDLREAFSQVLDQIQVLERS